MTGVSQQYLEVKCGAPGWLSRWVQLEVVVSHDWTVVTALDR